MSEKFGQIEALGHSWCTMQCPLFEPEIQKSEFYSNEELYAAFCHVTCANSGFCKEFVSAAKEGKIKLPLSSDRGCDDL